MLSLHFISLLSFSFKQKLQKLSSYSWFYRRVIFLLGFLRSTRICHLSEKACQSYRPSHGRKKETPFEDWSDAMAEGPSVVLLIWH